MIIAIILAVIVWALWPTAKDIYDGTSLADEVSHQDIMATLDKLVRVRS